MLPILAVSYSLDARERHPEFRGKTFCNAIGLRRGSNPENFFARENMPIGSIQTPCLAGLDITDIAFADAKASSGIKYAL